MLVALAACGGLAAGLGLDRLCAWLGAPWPGTPLPRRRALLAAACAASFGLSAARHGLAAQTAWEMACAAYMLAVLVVDGERRVIPDRLNAGGLVLGLLLLVTLRPVPWLSALTGLLVVAGFFHAAWLLARGGLGGGDLKFSLGLGLYLGWPVALAGLLLGLALGAAVALWRLWARPPGWREPFAYGPALAMGALLALHWGDWLGRLLP